MYNIQKQPKILSARKSIDQTSSLGLGISVLQLGFDLYNFSQIDFINADESLLVDGNSKSQEEEASGHHQLNCGTSCENDELEKISDASLPTSKAHLPFSQPELGRCFIIVVMLSAQLFLVIVDTFLHRFLPRATQKV